MMRMVEGDIEKNLEEPLGGVEGGSNDDAKGAVRVGVVSGDLDKYTTLR